ncbi:MAG: O-antigen ligase family protein, partial [Xanthomonadales bacterium]|nr:O-antigen ligase family protein [Xanthomonadales bacterium]
PSLRSRLCWAGGLLLAVVLAVGVAWQFSPKFDARIERTLMALHDTRAGLNKSLSGRLSIWTTSARMIAAHPINGVGVRGFRYAYPEYAAPGDRFVAEQHGDKGAYHAHQWVLEVLSETGVIGLLLWCAGFAVAWRTWRRADASARRRAWPFTLALGVMLFPLNTHLAFYSAWWGLLFWWLLVLWCVAVRGLKTEDGGLSSRQRTEVGHR